MHTMCTNVKVPVGGELINNCLRFSHDCVLVKFVLNWFLKTQTGQKHRNKVPPPSSSSTLSFSPTYPSTLPPLHPYLLWLIRVLRMAELSQQVNG